MITPVSIPKVVMIILIQVVVALIYVFRLGQLLDGELYLFYYSYFSDFILPFSAYFLLSVNDNSIPVLRKWYVKAGMIFTLTTLAEICQFFGIEALGVTFDVFDIMAYGLGVLTAAIFEVKILIPRFDFWQTDQVTNEK